MAYQTGVSSSIENLLLTLSTFLQANGWTEDFQTSETATPGLIGFSKNGMFVAYIYQEGGLVSGTPTGVIGVYASTSNDNSGSPWLSTGDDGQGYNNPISFPTSIFSQRHIANMDGPHVAYHFFEQDSSPAYFHVVVEIETNRFRHFGVGELEKIGDWVGGEYYYGNVWSSIPSQIDQPAGNSHRFLLDGRCNNSTSAPSVRAENVGLLNGAEEWIILGGVNYGYASLPDDRAGNNRAGGGGGSRDGPIVPMLCGFNFSQLSAFKPLMPIPVWYFDSNVAPDTVILLGTQPDVRIVNMANIEPGETIIVAGETWFVFPWSVKKFEQNDTEESWNAGVAYRQETA